MACKACNDKGFVRMNRTVVMCEECYNFADNAAPKSHEAMMALVNVSQDGVSSSDLRELERSAERHFEATAYRGGY